ncbi:MAG: hypothetical protein HUN04_24600 [Desulfobacter sp.]|nr:MAG: hypothetical protein HUN04_24600 [Desulfobacter sp.]
MERKMLEKNLIFYNPGMKGAVFTLAAKNYVSPDLVHQTREYLEYETEYPVNYTIERRAEPRPE